MLTLACCKPKIRQTARVGDIVVGMSRRCERVVYAMEVGEVIGFEQYWTDPRYLNRRPTWNSASLVDRNGDNIYEPAGDDFRQMHSWHSNSDGSENSDNKRRDLGDNYDNNVLVSEQFAYWGGSGPLLPAQLVFLRIGIGYRCRFTADQVEAVESWFETESRGLLGAPTNWKSGDESWRES